MRRRLFIVALSAVFLAGCVTASVSRLDNTQRPPLETSEVTIYLEEDDIPGEFEKMAVIDISGTSGWTDEEQLYNKAREEAAKIGANGVLFESLEEAGTGEKVASALFGTGADNDAKMIAIYVSSTNDDSSEGS